LLAWLFVALGIAIASSVLPVLSVEVFVVAFAADHPHLPVLLFGAVAAIGQVAGKLLYFYAARGSLHLPAFMHRTASASQRTENPAPAGGLKRWWHVVVSPAPEGADRGHGEQRVARRAAVPGHHGAGRPGRTVTAHVRRGLAAGPVRAVQSAGRVTEPGPALVAADPSSSRALRRNACRIDSHARRRSPARS
jgi:hypothetical protein